MASKHKIRIGDVWADSKGRRLRVEGGLDARGKIPLHNVQTNRPINSKGPRALVRLIVQGQGPKITQAAAMPNPGFTGYPGQYGAPPPSIPAPGRGAGRRKLTPAQIAAGFGGGNGKKKLPAKRKKKSGTPAAVNPKTYPSPLAKAVAVAMHNLAPQHAHDPGAVRAAALRAISGFGGGAQPAPPQHRTVMAAPNPFGESFILEDDDDYGFDPDLDLGMPNPGPHHLAPPPPPVVGYPGQYGFGHGMDPEPYYGPGGGYRF